MPDHEAVNQSIHLNRLFEYDGMTAAYKLYTSSITEYLSQKIRHTGRRVRHFGLHCKRGNIKRLYGQVKLKNTKARRLPKKPADIYVNPTPDR